MNDHHDDEGLSPTCKAWDPLAKLRLDDDPPLDVLTTGTVFFDIIFAGLARIPEPGEEIWSSGMGSCPGGIANLSTALARLGLKTGLVAGFGDDAYADWMWETLSTQERIDLSESPRYAHFHSAITASMTVGGDRAMVTHGHPLPESLTRHILAAPQARAAVLDLAGENDWWGQLAERGTVLFADVGFDETGKWDPADLAPLHYCFGFTPNSVEAMNYTRTDSPAVAVRKIADLVPFAVVTDGVNGSYAIDQESGEEAFCPALPVSVVDATGAGDVFASALVLGTLAKWPLEHRLRFASLCAALAVQEFGGSLAAPGWGDIADWWRALRDVSERGDLKARYLSRDYEFLEGIVPPHAVSGVRRAEGTFMMQSHLDTTTALADEPDALAVTGNATP